MCRALRPRVAICNRYPGRPHLSARLPEGRRLYLVVLQCRNCAGIAQLLRNVAIETSRGNVGGGRRGMPALVCVGSRASPGGSISVIAEATALREFFYLEYFDNGAPIAKTDDGIAQQI
jgi:hypothetical protein